MSNPAAAIDFGTNSFRLLIAEPTSTGYRTLVNTLSAVRLGDTLNSSGRLSQAAISRGLECVADFAELTSRYTGITIRACGTAALRDAANSHEFTKPAAKILNTVIEIIPAEQEAELSLQGCLAGLGTIRHPVCVIDAGGGSTEFVFQHEAAQPATSFSIPAGAVTLTERFMSGQSPSPLMDEHLRTLIGEGLNTLPPPWPALFSSGDELQLIGTGGTATALAALDLDLHQYDAHVVQDYRLKADRLAAIKARLCALPVADRNALPGLDQNRGQIIVAGLIIYQVILEISRTTEIIISDAGLLEGILLSILTPH